MTIKGNTRNNNDTNIDLPKRRIFTIALFTYFKK